MKLSLKSYLRWFAINLAVLLILGLTIYLLFIRQKNFHEEAPYPALGFSHFAEIVSHNLLNAAQTLLGFVLLPVMYLYTWGYSLITISMGFSSGGLDYVLSRLLPHALIEVPTILAYQYFAFGLLKTAVQTKKIETAIDYLRINRPFLCWCLLGIVLGALVEGFIG